MSGMVPVVQRVSDFVRISSAAKSFNDRQHSLPTKGRDAANRLLVYNVRRDASKATTRARRITSEDYHLKSEFASLMMMEPRHGKSPKRLPSSAAWNGKER